MWDGSSAEARVGTQQTGKGRESKGKRPSMASGGKRTEDRHGRSGQGRTMDKMRLIIKNLKCQTFFKNYFSSAFCVC